MADLTITAGNVLAGTGATKATYTAGASITAGKAVYKDGSDNNKIKLADANGSAAVAAVFGIALNGASAGQPVEVLTAGDIDPGGTVTVGKPYVLSETAGGICPHADLTSTATVSFIGWGMASNKITVAINNTGVAIP